jgi:hypothetical protein
MGLRAEKNRLAHGYVTTMTGSGPTGTYRTERPDYVAERAKHHNSYANVGEVASRPPKRPKVVAIVKLEDEAPLVSEDGE